ncbi:response regulator transcription factor [Poseidonocella sp. HB161398]|uniref:response regulator transcription factor n=1 Tax=Poseidonocella sp. HB161398 TaxID=2320855 RepID=UPI0014867AFC|nr:response regulator [Poseidonocella sp. HB161398]
MTAPTDTAARKVMLVESEDSLAHAMDHLATADGHACARLSPGDRILERVASDHPDLLMLDLAHGDRAQMLDACQSIRRNPALADIRILMLQSRGGRLEERRIRALGADGLVSLPFRLEELRAEMRRLLAEQQPVH